MTVFTVIPFSDEDLLEQFPNVHCKDPSHAEPLGVPFATCAGLSKELILEGFSHRFAVVHVGNARSSVAAGVKLDIGVRNSALLAKAFVAGESSGDRFEASNGTEYEIVVSARYNEAQ